MSSKAQFLCFPDDIWIQISPVLHSHDLTNLCLAHTHLAELLQYRLFDSVVLSSRDRAEGLLEIAQYKPQLLAQTHQLILWDQRYGAHKSPELLQWLQSVDAVRALRCLPRLDVLELDALVFSSLESTRGVKTIAENVPIKTLRLTRCKFPLTAAAFTIMEMFNHILSLEFVNTIIGPPPGNGATALRQVRRQQPKRGEYNLVSFKVLENPDSLPSFPFDSISKWLIDSGRIVPLRSIHVAIRVWIEFQQLADLFRHISTTLHHLHIDLNISDHMSFGVAHWLTPPLPIESLESVVVVGMKRPLISKIAYLLGCIVPTTRNIPALTMTIADERMSFDYRPDSPLQILNAWHQLDQIATRADKVFLTFILLKSQLNPDVHNAEKLGAKLFPKSTKRGGLHMDFATHYISKTR